MVRELLRAGRMRSKLLAVLFLLTACGGSVAPGSSGSSGSSGTSGTSGSGGGDTGSDTGSGSSGVDGTSSRCTAGAYVFCRCSDRSEGTKQCQKDGKSFAACTCPSAPVQCEGKPPAPNPPGCPDVYAHAYGGTQCGDVALECSYPGQGDTGSDGCPRTALLSCRVAPDGSRRWYASP